MLVEPPPTAEPLSYLVRRIAVYLGAREALFSSLIAADAKADGWLAVEALFALSRPLTSGQRITSARLGGLSQGGSADEPDLEFELDGQPQLLRITSTPLTPERTLHAYFGAGGELAPAFQLLAAQPAGAILVVVSYPVQLVDAEWTATSQTATSIHEVALVDQVQFQLPGPHRVVVSLWRHASNAEGR